MVDEGGNVRTLNYRKRFFNYALDTCSSIAYKSGTKKFKFTSISPHLITIDPDFNGEFLPVAYDKIEGFELDSGKGKYDELLTKAEIPEHKGWLAAMEDDKKLLEEAVKITFSVIDEPEKAMAFRVRRNTSKDELRALYADNLGENSGVDGYSSLNLFAWLLRLTLRII